MERYLLRMVVVLTVWLAAVSAASAQTAVEYIHTDALGTPVAVTNSAGVVIERSVYEPYGELINRPLTDGPGFTGHVQDTATGLTYMQQRYYDPQVGLFLSVDAMTAYDNGDMRFLHRYGYAFSNPYKFNDPDGRQARCSGSSCGPLDLINNLSAAASWVSDKAEATKAKLDRVDIRLEASAAFGLGIEGSVSLLRGDGEIGFIAVGQGADVNVSIQPREGFKKSFVDKPADAPIQFSGAGEIKGGAILHVGVESKLNPGGTMEVVPKVGVGAGEMTKFSPTINFIKWDPLTSDANKIQK